MYGTFAICLASYYFGFYTWMFINFKPYKSIKDEDNNSLNKVKYKQL